jgi:hypothetical protein
LSITAPNILEICYLHNLVWKHVKKYISIHASIFLFVSPVLKVSVWWCQKGHDKVLWAVVSATGFVLFDCLEPRERFFSYLAAVTITADRATNLDLYLLLTAFSKERSFTWNTFCDTGPPFWRSYPKDPWFSLLNAVLLAK